MKKDKIKYNKFGRLEVIRISIIKKNIYYDCLCECGKSITVKRYNLTSGRTVSCGCQSAITRVKKTEDLIMDMIGVKISKWTILEYVGRKNNVPYLRCRCECGIEKEVSYFNLKNNKSKDCGCGRKNKLSNNKINMVGDKIGKLTVLNELSTRDNYNKIMYRCECECGNIIDILGNSLRIGHTVSCGCINSKNNLHISKLLQDNNIEFISEKIFKDCKHIGYLKFDFFIPTLNIAIEYDGEHHFHLTNWNDSEKLKSQKIRDKIKDNYCIKNNIRLIRIPYTEKKYLKNILYKELNITVND